MPAKENLPEGLPALFTELERSFDSSMDLAGDGEQQFMRGVSRVDPLTNAYRAVKGENSDTSFLSGLADIPMGFVKAGFGAAGAALSPVDASVRSFIGNPVENSTGLPSGLTSFLAELAFPAGWSKAGSALEGLNDLANVNKFDAGLGTAAAEVRKPTS